MITDHRFVGLRQWGINAPDDKPCQYVYPCGPYDSTEEQTCKKLKGEHGVETLAVVPGKSLREILGTPEWHDRSTRVDKNKHEFMVELTKLINKYSLENGSDTPDYVLADFLLEQINAFDRAVGFRERWHGRSVGVMEGL